MSLLIILKRLATLTLITITVLRFGPSQVHAASNFPLFIFHMNNMIFDMGVSINKITDHNDYYLVTGNAPSKLSAYLLADKLLHAQSLNRFELIDVVPSWHEKRFDFYFVKKKNETKSLTHTIETPSPREQISKKIMLEGKCMKNGTEITIGGDLSGNTKCINGKWTIELNAPDKDLPLIGVKVSFWHEKQKPFHSYRSFLSTNLASQE